MSRSPTKTPEAKKTAPGAGSASNPSSGAAATAAAPSSTSPQGELQKKSLTHDQIKPGMLLWTTNPEEAILMQYFGSRVFSSASRRGKPKHWELVLDKGSDGKSAYVVTVHLTSFGKATSLKDSGIDQDKWDQIVPQAPKTKESHGQYGPVKFKRGLKSTSGGWITVHRTTMIRPKEDGTYDAMKTEMDEVHLKELLKRAKANEKSFNMEKIQLQQQGNQAGRDKKGSSSSGHGRGAGGSIGKA